MKTVINFVITLAAVTLFAACGNPQKKETADAQPGRDHATGEGHGAATEATSSSVSLKEDKLNAVYPHYVHLNDALVKGEVAEAKVAANAIELGSKKLTDGATLAAAAAKIALAPDIDAQRIIFADLSANFIERIKTSGLKGGDLFILHCPMALNDKGAHWVNTTREIRNPYFGESMLTCGSVQQTITRH